MVAAESVGSCQRYANLHGGRVGCIIIITLCMFPGLPAGRLAAGGGGGRLGFFLFVAGFCYG